MVTQAATNSHDHFCGQLSLMAYGLVHVGMGESSVSSCWDSKFLAPLKVTSPTTFSQGMEIKEPQSDEHVTQQRRGLSHAQLS